MSNNKGLFMVMDDTDDVGKEPLPIEDEAEQKIHDALLKKYKVKYIKASDVSLTNGKIYDVLDIEEGSYRIMDDTEDDYLFDPDDFEIIKE